MERQAVSGLSSMATRAVLLDLARRVSAGGPADVEFTSGGGVDVARWVRDGEVADVLVLAEGAVESLEADGHVRPGTARPLFLSEVVVAVPTGDGSSGVGTVETVERLREALVGAAAIGYSTGPSGDAVLRLLDEWGLRELLDGRLVRASPGVPVGELLATGRADLGFQQRSELTGVEGVHVLGSMPPGAEVRTTFTGAVLATTGDAVVAQAVLQALASPAWRALVAGHGLTLHPSTS